MSGFVGEKRNAYRFSVGKPEGNLDVGGMIV
jgi:hypothetical protein